MDKLIVHWAQFRGSGAQFPVLVMCRNVGQTSYSTLSQSTMWVCWPIQTHTIPWGRLLSGYLSHQMYSPCGLMSGLASCKYRKEYGLTWHRMTLLRPDVIKQHKLNQTHSWNISATWSVIAKKKMQLSVERRANQKWKCEKLYFRVTFSAKPFFRWLPSWMWNSWCNQIPFQPETFHLKYSFLHSIW